MNTNHLAARGEEKATKTVKNSEMFPDLSIRHICLHRIENIRIFLLMMTSAKFRVFHYTKIVNMLSLSEKFQCSQVVRSAVVHFPGTFLYNQT